MATVGGNLVALVAANLSISRDISGNEIENTSILTLYSKSYNPSVSPLQGIQQNDVSLKITDLEAACQATDPNLASDFQSIWRRIYVLPQVLFLLGADGATNPAAATQTTTTQTTTPAT